MTEDWDPTRYHDTYREDVLALVKKKIRLHQTKTVTAPDEKGARQPTAKIIDLMALLKRSIETKKGGASAPSTAVKKHAVQRRSRA